MKLIATTRFNREFMALLKSHRLTEAKADKIFHILANNPRHPSLRLHKLSGTNNFSASVNRDIRIIFNREGDIIYLSRIGSHDEVY